MLAADALQDLTGVESAVLGVAAQRTLEALRPAGGEQRLLALGLAAIAFQERRNAQAPLELDLILWNI